MCVSAWVLSVLAICFMVSASAAEKKASKKPETGTEKGDNILFFGNSFTIGSGARETSSMNGIPGLVKTIAI